MDGVNGAWATESINSVASYILTKEKQMGTNYYAIPNRPSIREPIHIGKSSYGWKFLFRRRNERWNDPPVVWNTFNQVKDWLYKYTVESQLYVIIDENDEIIPFDDFIEFVESKQDVENEDNFTWADNVDGYRFTDGDFS